MAKTRRTSLMDVPYEKKLLTIFFSYPSFNKIHDRKVESCTDEFSQNRKTMFKTLGKKNNSPLIFC